MISASWDLYLETLNYPTLTAMVNQLKCQGPWSPRTKPTRNPHLQNLSYLLLPNALISMQEPCSPSPSYSLMLSTGLSICKVVSILSFATKLILHNKANWYTELYNIVVKNIFLTFQSHIFRAVETAGVPRSKYISPKQQNLEVVDLSPLKYYVGTACMFLSDTGRCA